MRSIVTGPGRSLPSYILTVPVIQIGRGSCGWGCVGVWVVGRGLGVGVGVGVAVPPPLPGALEVPVCPPCWAITLEIARDAAAIRIIAGQIRITAASCLIGLYSQRSRLAPCWLA